MQFTTHTGDDKTARKHFATRKQAKLRENEHGHVTPASNVDSLKNSLFWNRIDQFPKKKKKRNKFEVYTKANGYFLYYPFTYFHYKFKLLTGVNEP